MHWRIWAENVNSFRNRGGIGKVCHYVKRAHILGMM